LDSGPNFYKVSGFTSLISTEQSERLFYNACTACRRKVREEVEGWKCEHCDKWMATPDPTFMFAVRLQDFSGDVSLQFAREAGAQLLGVSANEFKHLLEQPDGTQKVQALFSQ